MYSNLLLIVIAPFYLLSINGNITNCGGEFVAHCFIIVARFHSVDDTLEEEIVELISLGLGEIVRARALFGKIIVP